jgi:hypothetical protein
MEPAILLELVRDVVERVGDVVAERRHGRDSGDGYEGRDKPYSIAVAPESSLRKRLKRDMGDLA